MTMHASECSTVNRNKYRHKAVKFNAKVNPRVRVFATFDLTETQRCTHFGLNRLTIGNSNCGRGVT
jgi:hypothetical protein